MSQDVVAKRYAVALFQLTNEQNSLEQVEEELTAVQKVLNENEDFLALLAHPKITREQKKTFFKDAFANVSESVINTLLLLIDRKREDVISDMVDYFIELANDARGVADAAVYSVRELSKDEEKAISEIFSKRIGKEKLHIHNIVDKSLLGGVKIRIGNTIFDGSVKRKLERLERQIVSAKS
jgi:F-type H+-transporting ATPase subunit delta